MAIWGMVISETVSGVALRLTGTSAVAPRFAKSGIWLTRTWSTLIDGFGSSFDTYRGVDRERADSGIEIKPQPCTRSSMLPVRVGSPIVTGSRVMSPTGNGTVPGALKSR